MTEFCKWRYLCLVHEGINSQQGQLFGKRQRYRCVELKKAKKARFFVIYAQLTCFYSQGRLC
jgi:hypothetical protein